MRLQLLRVALPFTGPVCALRRLSSPPTSRALSTSPNHPHPAPRGLSAVPSVHLTLGTPVRQPPPFSARSDVRMTSAAAASEGLVAGHTEENCIFCKIRDGVIPSTKILETEHAIAILDAFPMTRGHTLLIPKKHYAFLEDMPADEAAAVMQELPKLSKAVRIATGAKGVNVAQNNGTVAGQVVFHVHIHILPRVEDDGLLKLGKSGGMIEASEAAAVKESIAAALASSSL